jgi:hypothetical protein
MVTAAEIKLLQHIHGDNERGNPGVVQIKKLTKAVRRGDDAEREHLAQRYTSSKHSGKMLVDKVFGVGTPMPCELADITVGDAPKPVIEGEGEIVDLEAMKDVRRTRIAKEPAQIEA